jgi:hypothetical protein
MFSSGLWNKWILKLTEKKRRAGLYTTIDGNSTVFPNWWFGVQCFHKNHSEQKGTVKFKYQSKKTAFTKACYKFNLIKCLIWYCSIINLQIWGLVEMWKWVILSYTVCLFFVETSSGKPNLQRYDVTKGRKTFNTSETNCGYVFFGDSQNRSKSTEEILTAKFYLMRVQ